MNTVLKCVIGLDLLNCHAKISRAIRSAVLEKMTFVVAIFGNFPDIPEINCHFRRSIWLAGCDVR